MSRKIQFSGVADRVAEFLVTEHLYNRDLWKKFVDVFRTRPDGINRGWRGEYWGKMMRGAVLIYKYTRDERLYGVLSESVRDMLTVIESDGFVSSYSRESELTGWDLWSRKYVILGCEYFVEICKEEELKEKIISFISLAADYVLEKIGPEKIKITKASNHWLGLNSSSILEPIVRLYKLTGEKRYLDFASYIVEEGGAEGINIFALAYENKLYPYQYGVSKAYEMTSCFEGLLLYYEVTGISKYKTAVLNYARAVLESEMSIIGCAGTTHELFDHTVTRETAIHDADEVMQETCVSVTLMKFFAKVLSLSDDTRYADAIEKTFYNAYLGALNTERCESEYPYKTTEGVVSTILPFDAYSPLTFGRRGRVVGGYQVMPDMSYYGCCACIGCAGVGVFIENAVTVCGDTVTLNFYERGEIKVDVLTTKVCINIDTEYPKDEKIRISIRAEEPVDFTLRLRKPAWSDGEGGYTVYKKTWTDDVIEILLDMPLLVHTPKYTLEDTVYTDVREDVGGYYTALPVKVSHLPSEEKYIAFTRGPLTLCADSRTGKPAESVFSAPEDYTVCESSIAEGVPCILKMKLFTAGGESYYLVDYGHAGRDWKTTIAAWLRTE